MDEVEAERLANSRFRRILRGVERADRINRMMVWIVVGLAIQVRPSGSEWSGSIVADFHRSHSLFSFSLVRRSSIQAMASLITLSRALPPKLGCFVAKVGNGGCLLSGSSFGLGFMRPTCYGNLAAFVMSTAGAFRQSVAA